MTTKRYCFLAATLAIATIGAGLGLTPATAAAQVGKADGFDVPYVRDFRDLDPDYLYDPNYSRLYRPDNLPNSNVWRQLDTNCGSFGCHGSDHWFTSTPGAYAQWWMIDMQGMYELEVKYPHGPNESLQRRTNGTIRWEIWEKRPGDNRYRRIFFRDHYQDGTGGTHRPLPGPDYGYAGIPLDGRVAVVARYESGYIAVDDVTLEYRGVLPAHDTLMQDYCQDKRAQLYSALSITSEILVGIVGGTFAATAAARAALQQAGAAIGIISIGANWRRLTEHDCKPYWNAYTGGPNIFNHRSEFKDDIAVFSAYGFPYTSGDTEYCPRRGIRESDPYPQWSNKFEHHWC
ncbi:MAG: hypothetical protein F4076_08505 [Acidimicrobiaceae bacterium]|nr:hypothetical protein [Acidimicrobiaceae bacterium]MXZ98594.1 hypothetical protein [Acidimicrobiaceae bacterium]MYE75729.1 hypothetical protein [Acidimicrobiaceae bacterium]MYJ42465.1 hypothetical protein [Acidimicrobiaceae bacterium]